MLPLLLMVLSALCYSWVLPLLILSGGTGSLFLWNLIYRMGGCAGGILVLWASGLRAPLPGLSREGFRSLGRLSFWLAFMSFLNFTVLSWATRLAGPALASVVHSVWPLFFILLMGRFMGGRYDRPGLRTLGLVLLSFLGVVLVVQSRDGIGAPMALSTLLAVILQLLRACVVPAGAGGPGWVWRAARRASAR